MRQHSIEALHSFSGVGPVDTRESATALLAFELQTDLVRLRGFTFTRLTQRGLAEAARQSGAQLDCVILKLGTLLARARSGAQRIIHVRTDMTTARQSGGLDMPDQATPITAEHLDFIEELTPGPGETVVPKVCECVFMGTDLHDRPRDRNVDA